MDTPKVCLTLTGKTLQEDLAILDKYRKYIDIAELRVDLLDDEERLYARRFPKMAGLPCILTIRRTNDGGLFEEGEAGRTILFARALAFASEESNNNFAYVDFEEDFKVSSLQDAALAFGTKIIRSVHSMESPITDISAKLRQLCTTSYEIPKIAFMPNSLEDVESLFVQAAKLPDSPHILLAMGDLGVPTRILGSRLKNYLTYTSASESNGKIKNLSHIDPVTLDDVYHFRKINPRTRLFGITGWPLVATSSPQLHNHGYDKKNMDAVYIPVRAEQFRQALSFADSIGMEGLSVTIPHKEAVFERIADVDTTARIIGSCNTVVKSGGTWHGFNTDFTGFTRALCEFTGKKSLMHKKVAIIGAGGAARSIAYAVKKMGGAACVFNRTVARAKDIADHFGFKYAPLSLEALPLLKRYNDVIIQTTSKGMNARMPATEQNDPLYFYEFTGKELLFDIVYMPSVTPVMHRAALAGCRTCNGYDMLRYQGYEQFELFTGERYDG